MRRRIIRMDASSCIIPAGRFPIGVYNSPFDTRPVAFVKFLSPVFCHTSFLSSVQPQSYSARNVTGPDFCNAVVRQCGSESWVQIPRFPFRLLSVIVTRDPWCLCWWGETWLHMWTESQSALFSYICVSGTRRFVAVLEFGSTSTSG